MPTFKIKSLLLFVVVFSILFGAMFAYVKYEDELSNRYRHQLTEARLFFLREKQNELLSIQLKEKRNESLSEEKSKSIDDELSVIESQISEQKERKRIAEILVGDGYDIYEEGMTVIISSSIFGSIFYFLILGARKLAFSFSSQRLRANDFSDEAHEIQKDLTEDFFTKLVKINFKYLDAYYLQTQVQSDKSFVLTASAAALSLVVIIFGVIMMFVSDNESMASKVTVSVGAFGQFISAIFFYLYNRTVLKMGEYHQKLVLTQNIGLALKIAQELPEEHRIEPQKNLISSLVKDINVHLSGNSEPNRVAGGV